MATHSTTIMNDIKKPPRHYGQDSANQQLDWMPTDTKEHYEKLIQDPVHKQYFSELGWDQPGAITYKLNSQGFRCDEFDGGPYVLALGCSYTAGIGLPYETLWPTLVGEQLGLKVANLAWGGYSADTCFRLAEYWIPELRPDYVCMLTPPRSRIELMLDEDNPQTRKNKIEIFMPQSQSKLYSPNDQYLKHWFINGENARLNQVKNILALRQFCADLNIKCAVYNAEEYMCGSREIIGYARDHMHAGPPIHKELAKKFVDDYKKF